MEKEESKIRYWSSIGTLLVMPLLFAALFFELNSGVGKIDYSSQTAAVIKKEDPIKFLFVGDIMFDRGVRNAIEREGVKYPFNEIKSMFSRADLVVGNLEGTFTHEPSIAQRNNEILRFTFDPSLAAVLKSLGFSGVSLANNHSLDFGSEGYISTEDTLKEQGIFYFGSALNDKNLSTRITKKGEEICFVGYHQLFNPSLDLVLREIDMIKPLCNYVVSYVHWGDEYQDEENESQRKIGRALIDAGVDLVIGHHPHVIQPIGVYKNKAIFYSLGNFLFDQDFSLSTRQTFAVRLELTKEEQRFEIVPLEMSRARLYFPLEESFAPKIKILTSELPLETGEFLRSEMKFVLPRLEGN